MSLSGSPPAQRLFGRDVEIATLRGRLDAAAAGRGGVVVVSGEPGSGKSALASVITTEAQARGLALSLGRALDFTDAPPWFPMGACLRSLGVGRDAVGASPDQIYGLWEEVLESLARASTQTPVVWVLEDLHAADAHTLDLLAFLAHPIRALAVLVVVTMRPLEAMAPGAAAERLGRLRRDAQTIALGPLAASAVATLVESAADRALQREVVDEIVAHAAGNPLFAIELARSRRGARAGAELPPTVIQVVLERLAALPPACRDLLEHAAVLGRETSAAVLGRFVGKLPAAVIDGLAPALRVGLVDELAPGRFQFSHALVCQAIHDALPAARRQRDHARAEAILAEHGDTLDVLALRATHVLAAHDAIDAARATDVVTKAIARLVEGGAADRAYAIHRRWLETRAAPRDPASLLDAAALAAAAGSFADARAFADEVIAYGRAHGNVALVGAGALALGSHLQPGVVDPHLVRVLEEALAGLDAAADADPALRCRVRARLAAALQPSPEPEIPVAMANAAIAEARASGDAALLRNVLFIASSALIDFTDASECVILATELGGLADAAGDRPLALRAAIRRMFAALELGDISAFTVGTDRIIVLARGIGHPTVVWRALLVGSMRALARGDFAESERFATEVDEIARVTDDPALAISRMAHMGVRLVGQDDETFVREHVSEYASSLSAAPAPVRAFLLAIVAVRIGDRDEAGRQLAIMLDFGIADRDTSTLGIAGEAAALAGTDAVRRSLHQRLLPLAARCMTASQISFGFEGTIMRVLGVLEASLGEHASAIDRLQSARVQCVEHGLWAWVVRIDVDLGRVHAARGDRAEARARFAEAIERGRSIKLTGAVLRAEAGLRALGSATPTVAIEPKPTAAMTLAREGDAWRLGWSGREIVVRDSRGMQLLARLVTAPGERLHVLALASDDGKPLDESDAGPALDADAMRAYRARLAELDEALEAAEASDDVARAEKIDREREAITAELRRSVGLGGRVRKVGSATERARVAVTRRLRETVARIGEAHPDLGRYLDEAVRTGTYCTFRP